MFYLDNKPITRAALIKKLIEMGQTVPYSKTRKMFRKEVREDQLPELYLYKKSGIVKAAVKD